MPKINRKYISKLLQNYQRLLGDFCPTNGFIAFEVEALKEIDLQKTDNRFLKQTIFNVLKEYNQNVAIDAKYTNNYSSLKPLKEIFPFLFKNIKLLFKNYINIIY